MIITCYALYILFVEMRKCSSYKKKGGYRDDDNDRV